MKITFDPVKRQVALLDRGLDFLDASIVFAGPTITVQDMRRDYGEVRFQTVGYLAGRNGDGRPDAARQGATCDFDEEMQ